MGIDAIILIATAVIIGFAVRSIVKNAKSGGCAGCSGCTSCDSEKNSCSCGHSH